ncbi:hypothetical protein C2845_PM10G17420 [Panicum miliaceum]|uniref:Uncharacterized protein n=1 Tax=Panicum miliaceum TaxID=4540 RepID=A0A3L6P9Y8_PANMI|nr:hypothetical protein C2845_PM10G17420 [Panicum miliaceum]
MRSRRPRNIQAEQSRSQHSPQRQQQAKEITSAAAAGASTGIERRHRKQDPTLPGHAPDQDPPADPAPTVPNPNPRRRSTVARPRACNPTRRGGAGRGVAPRKQGSEAGCRSGTGPAPTASPFLTAAVFSPRAAGIGVVITGRREWEQAAVMADWWHSGMVQDYRSSHRAHASPPPPRRGGLHT